MKRLARSLIVATLATLALTSCKDEVEFEEAKDLITDPTIEVPYDFRLYGKAEYDRFAEWIGAGNPFMVIEGAFYEPSTKTAFIRPIVRRANGEMGCTPGVEPQWKEDDIIYHPSDGRDSFPYHIAPDPNTMTFISLYGGADEQTITEGVVKINCINPDLIIGNFGGGVPGQFIYDTGGMVSSIKMNQSRRGVEVEEVLSLLEPERE